MSRATLLVHAVAHPTVTLFVEASTYREQFLAEYPDEDGPILRVRIDAPEGVSVSPSSQSDLFSGRRGSSEEYSIIVDADHELRASFDWAVDVPDRSHLDSEQVTVTLLDADGATLDHANILI